MKFKLTFKPRIDLRFPLKFVNNNIPGATVFSITSLKDTDKSVMIS